MLFLRAGENVIVKKPHNKNYEDQSLLPLQYWTKLQKNCYLGFHKQKVAYPFNSSLAEITNP